MTRRAGSAGFLGGAGLAGASGLLSVSVSAAAGGLAATFGFTDGAAAGGLSPVSVSAAAGAGFGLTATFGLAAGAGGGAIWDGMICSSSRSCGCCKPGDARGPDDCAHGVAGNTTRPPAASIKRSQ